jgi:hypothetical protein
MDNKTGAVLYMRSFEAYFASLKRSEGTTSTMAKIAPFRGILYNQVKAGTISALVCPPYDIISPAEQQDLYRKNPYNVVRLEFGLTSPADTEEIGRAHV